MHHTPLAWRQRSFSLDAAEFVTPWWKCDGRPTENFRSMTDSETIYLFLKDYDKDGSRPFLAK